MDLSTWTALVTGASSGIGKECARVLALRGARVIMANRNREKPLAVIGELSKSIGSDEGNRLEFAECDTSRMNSVRALADAIATRGERIDILLLNAGVFGLPYFLTEDNFERTLATNYIGHFLLIYLLVNSGSLTYDARIVATQTSAIQNPFAKLDLPMLDNPQLHHARYRRAMSSPNSKVLLALFMTEFARRVRNTAYSRVTFNSGDPGATLTDNINQIGGVLGAISRAVGPMLFKSVEEGAAVLVWAATNPELGQTTAACYSHKLKRMNLPAKCIDPVGASQAWDATVAALKLLPWS